MSAGSALRSILRTCDLRDGRVLPVFQGSPAPAEARSVLHFVIPAAGKLAGELRGYSLVREAWVLEALLGEHTKLEALDDGFVLHWGEIPAECPDIRADVELIPLRVFGVPLFL